MSKFLALSSLKKLGPNISLLSLNHSFYLAQKRFDSTSSPSVKTVEVLTEGSTQASNKLSFFTDSPITQSIEDALISIHDSCSLEWSTTIFISALAFRLAVCFPIKVYQENLMSKLVNLQPKINDALEKSFKSVKKDSIFASPELKKKLARQTVLIRNYIYKKENCQPQKIPISSLLQMPFWIYLSSAIRNLTNGLNDHGLQCEQITNESFLWMQSLALSDPHYVLPVVYCVLALSNITYSSLTGVAGKNVSKMFSFRKYLSMFFIFIIAVLISNMPSSIGLFWISSNFLSFIELVLLDSIFMRRLLRIPKTSVEPANIYLSKLSVVLSAFKKFKK